MNTEAPQPEGFTSLYRRAFTEYGTRALWNKRELEAPTPADALVVCARLAHGGQPRIPAAGGTRSSGPAVPLSKLPFVARMPTDKLGLLFLKAGEVVQPDPDRLDAHQTHAGQRRGQWPSSPEISAAMFERYNKKPSP